MPRCSALVCAPLHAFALPRTRAARRRRRRRDRAARRAALLPPHGLAFVLVAAAFAAYAFVPSALSAHLLAIFGRTGIDARDRGADRRAVRSGAGGGAAARIRVRRATCIRSRIARFAVALLVAAFALLAVLGILGRRPRRPSR